MAKVTDGLFLAFNTKSGKTYAISKSRMELIKVNKNIEDAFFKVKHKWSVIVAVLARAESGEVHVISRQVILSHKMRKTQLGDYLAKLHAQAGDDARYNYPGWELEDAAWIVDPEGKDWSEADINKALEVIT